MTGRTAADQSATVLVVDDDEKNRRLLEAFVVSCGHRAVFAENGWTALERMRQDVPDVVLLDVLMPEMDGYEVLARMQADPSLSSVPVIVITALDHTESAVRCIERGAADYLTKPYDTTLLRARLGACLEKKRLRDAERQLLEGTLRGSIKVLTDVLALANPLAFSRACRLRYYVRRMVERLGLGQPWKFEIAAMLSQIGCIALPDPILAKVYSGEDLTAEERKMLKAHPAIGRDLLFRIPRLADVVTMIAEQEEPPDKHRVDEALRQKDAATLGAEMLKVALHFDRLLMNNETRKDAVARMRSNAQAYHRALVDGLAGIRLTSAGSGALPLRLSELQPGMVFDEDVTTADGLLLVSKGQEISVAVLERLRQFAATQGVAEPIYVSVSHPMDRMANLPPGDASHRR